MLSPGGALQYAGPIFHCSSSLCASWKLHQVHCGQRETNPVFSSFLLAGADPVCFTILGCDQFVITLYPCLLLVYLSPVCMCAHQLPYMHVSPLSNSSTCLILANPFCCCCLLVFERITAMFYILGIWRYVSTHYSAVW